LGKTIGGPKIIECETKAHAPGLRIKADILECCVPFLACMKKRDREWGSTTGKFGEGSRVGLHPDNNNPLT
jgi:hypothetical protein